MKPNVWLFIAFLAISVTAFSQHNPVLFRNGTFHPEANIRPSYIDSFNQQLQRINNKAIALMQFSRVPTDADRKILAAYQVELMDYIPERTYTVVIAGNLEASILQRAGVRSVFLPSPSQKMDPFLGKNVIPAFATPVEGMVDILISYPSSFSLQDVMKELKSRNYQVMSLDHQAYRILGLRIPRHSIEALALLPCVEYVQVAPPADQPLVANSRFGSRANVLNASAANGGKGLNGEGVVIGVGDNADIQTHVDFADRLITRAPNPAAGHGHHVAGIAGGAGNIYEPYRGYASKATIITQNFSGIIRNAASYVQDHGMVITNNSYGNIIECGYHGTYDLLSRALDQMAFDLPYLSNVFAAGNSGHTTCAPFQPGYRTLLGSYQAAKNVITVGATNDSGVVAFFSSRGPVSDGRLKPEFLAMGQGVFSTWPINIYSGNNGTSMAAPGTSGGLALLIERYRQLHSGGNPKNGLMKAILANGAVGRGATGPDFQNGYGWMNLLRSLDMIENNRYVIGTISQGAQDVHTVTVPANTAQLKVMLYWNDPAGSMFASKALVNDLDLSVAAGSTIHRPAILDTANASLPNNAVPGIDRVNNIEQVVISQPAAGNYSIRIDAHAINQNPSQEYFLVYDFVPVQLAITHPFEGNAHWPATRTKINWEAHGLTGTVDIDFSADNGNTWSEVATGVDIQRPTFSWFPPDQPTSQARIRVRKTGTGETAVSGAFTIVGNTTLSLSGIQCEGYINIQWTAVSGATDYEVMMLQGNEMVSVATTTALHYSFSGLSSDSTYFVTVRPRVNGRPGIRAYAVNRKPDSGTCAGSFSDNDLKMDAIVSPVSGRKFTSTEPAASSVVRVRIKNLDDAPAGSVQVRYSFNNGPWVTETIPVALAAGASYIHEFTATVNVASEGSYTITAVVDNLGAADPVAKNDTVKAVIRTLGNVPLVLSQPFLDNLEQSESGSYTGSYMGIKGADRYDLVSPNAFGRVRSFVNTGMASSGNRAFTLDADRYVIGGTTSFIEGTFNLQSYTTAANDLRLDFRFLNHGQQDHTNNRVWIRGNDTQPWIEAFNLFQNQLEPGNYRKSESIELSHILSQAMQQFGTSFQVRWGQHGLTSASDRFTASGYSFDDIRIYEVFNDIQVKELVSPSEAGCGLQSASIIRIRVRNSSASTATNVPVKYRINNGSWVSETIPAILPNTAVDYDFAATADLSQPGNYNIQVVADYAPDSFRENDTLTKLVRNLPLITNYPYLQHFEDNEGGWYTGGTRSSWQYGAPMSFRIKRAASGNRVWKTNLEGFHNSSEHSYLYSPCFNITGMTAPTLSFSIALDIENCGTTICDAAWVEYSQDGNTWTKLGSSGSGTNWYNNGTAQIWTLQDQAQWRVATVALPTGLSNIRLRFVFKSDEGTERDGVALDDIHIYDNTRGIYDGVTLATPVSAAVSGNDWVDFVQNGKLVASIKANNQNLGSTAVGAFIHDGTVRYNNNQYYHHRNITINPSVSSPADSVRVRFYFLHTETDTLTKATGCGTCSRPASAWDLGVSKYSDPDPSFENGNVNDNLQGIWSFIPPADLVIVPFDKGYYAEFSVNHFSEFWLSTGGFQNVGPLPVKLMSFTAKKQQQDVVLNWRVGAEEDVNRYEIELARGTAAMTAGNYEKIGQVLSAGNTTTVRDYSFTDQEADKWGIRYYRLRIVNSNGTSQYAPVRSVSFDEAVQWQVYPNPSTGIFSLMHQAPAGERLLAKVYDSKGRLMYSSSQAGNGQVQKLEIDLTAAVFASGVYLLHIETGNTSRSFKLYKQ